MSTGAAAGFPVSTVMSTYSPEESCEQPKEQYERKDRPTVVEPVRLALSRNQRYQEALV